MAFSELELKHIKRNPARFMNLHRGVVAGVLALLLSSCAPAGRIATVFRDDFAPLRGRVIAVREGCVIIDTLQSEVRRLSAKDTLRRKRAWVELHASAIAIRIESITALHMKGEYYSGTGLLIGVGIGATLAAIASGASSTKESAISADFGLYLGAVAVLSGLTAGILATRPERMLHASDPGMERALKEASVFHADPPRELEGFSCGTVK